MKLASRTPGPSSALTRTLAGMAAGLGMAGGAFAQGDNNPPAGPVTYVYKTLDQVEPRKPISLLTTPGDADSVYRITQAGSYYLTGNVVGVAGKSGIEVAATSGVTIDLRGFDIVGVQTGLDGIKGPAAGGSICIRNGAIYGWGGDGIDLESDFVVHITGVRVSGNSGSGMKAGDGAVIVECNADSNTLDGIAVKFNGTISNCVSQLNGGDGFDVSDGTCISNCAANNNTGEGIHGVMQSGSGTGGMSVTNSVARNNRLGGIRADTVTGCTAAANGTASGGFGIQAYVVRNSTSSNNLGFGIQGNQVTGCYVSSNTRIGIYNTTGAAYVAENTVNANSEDGINVFGNSSVLRNTVIGNGTIGGFVGGITASGAGVRIEGNNLVNNRYHVRTSTGSCVIVSNTLRGAVVADYSFGGVNALGDSIAAGASLTTVSAWANLKY